MLTIGDQVKLKDSKNDIVGTVVKIRDGVRIVDFGNGVLWDIPVYRLELVEEEDK